MAKKAETAPIYVQRRSAGLWPEMKMDADAIARLPYGERIKVTISSARSPRRLRFYWSFLHKVVESTECCANAEALHSLIKLENGYTTPIKVKGFTVLVPSSISFESMGEDTFQEFLDKAIRYIAATFNVIPEEVFGSERME